MFKNNFGVKGPVSLLTALTQEAKKLGWKEFACSSNTWEESNNPCLYFNGNKEEDLLPIGQFWYPGSTDCNVQILPQDWDNCIKLLSEKKEEEYKIGEWLYAVSSGGYAAIFKYDGMNKDLFKSSLSIHQGEEHLIIGASSVGYAGEEHNVRKATEEEIKEFLIKAATQKGFVEGLKLKKVLCITDNQLRGYGGEIKRDSWVYISSDDTLRNTGVIIYNNGKWATIQEDQGLCFGDKNVHIYKDGHVTFDEYTANIKDLKAVYSWHYPSITVGGFPFHAWHNKVEISYNTKVKIGCTTGILGELKAIIDKYDELSEQQDSFPYFYKK